MEMANAPAKFKHAERITATLGFSAPVAPIDVAAIALAVSVEAVCEVENAAPRHDDQDQDEIPSPFVWGLLHSNGPRSEPNVFGGMLRIR